MQSTLLLLGWLAWVHVASSSSIADLTEQLGLTRICCCCCEAKGRGVNACPNAFSSGDDHPPTSGVAASTCSCDSPPFGVHGFGGSATGMMGRLTD